MSDSCSDLNGSLVRSVALIIKLGESTVANRDQLVEKILKDDKVRLALHEAFRAQALKLITDELAGKATSSAAQATTFVTAVGKASSPAAESAVKSQDKFKSAEQGLRELKCAFDKTPVGVFVDRNKGWLIFAGVIVAAGGAVLMYKTKTGDVPAAGLAKLGELTTKKIEIGKVTIGTSGLVFVPSKSQIGGGVSISLKDLDAVKTTFEIKTVVDAGTLKELTLSDTISVPLATGMTLSGKAGVGVKDAVPTYDLTLGVKYGQSGLALDVSAYVKGAGASQTIGASARAGYVTPLDSTFGKGSYLTAGAQGKIEGKRPDSSSSFQPEGTVTVGLGVTF
jgi:hypothetical protein